MDACYNPLINACYSSLTDNACYSVPHDRRTAHTTLDGVLSLRFDD